MSLSPPKPPKIVPAPNLPSRASFISRGRGFGIRPSFRRGPTPVMGGSTVPSAAKPSLIGG